MNLSVSSQKDTEQPAVAKAETLLTTQPGVIHDEIATYYGGATPELAAQVADDLMVRML